MLYTGVLWILMWNKAMDTTTLEHVRLTSPTKKHFMRCL
jgi:hypothetical protein